MHTMRARRLLILILLSGLGAFAGGRLFCILTKNMDTLGPFFGAAITFAIATGMLIPLTLLVDRPRVRAAGYASMIVVVLTALCMAGLIFYPSAGDTIGAMLMFALLFGIPSAGALFIISFPWARISTWVVVTCAVICFLVAATGDIDAFFHPAYFPRYATPVGERWMNAAAAFFLFGIGDALLLLNVGQRDKRYFRWPAILASFVPLALILYFLLSDQEPGVITSFIAASIIPPLFFAHLNLVLMARHRPSFLWIKWGTIAASAVCGILAMVAVVFESDELVGFLLAAGIPALCGSIALCAVPLMGRFDPRTIDYSTTLKEIHLACPRCSKKLIAPLGDSLCDGCGLQLTLQAREPRCIECGYMLYGITSPRCPECGTPIVKDATAPAATTI